MSKVLLTGGAGFIGSHLAKRLVELGRQVDLVDNLQRGVRDQFVIELAASAGVRLLELDLRDPQACARLDDDYDQIYHLAAIVGVANVAKAPYRVLADNVALLDAALGVAGRQRRLSRLAFTSTSEVYAGTLAQDELAFPTPEGAKLVVPSLDSPRTSYMLSKIYGEAMCKAASVPVTIFRPHNVYGPRMGMAHVIPELLQRASKAEDGDRLEVYSVDHSRTFCFIDDAVEMVVAAMDASGALGATLNLGNETPEVTIGELAHLVTEVVGRRLEIVPLPATAGSPSRRAPNTAAIRALTGYQPQVSLREGVERTFDWYRRNVFEA